MGATREPIGMRRAKQWNEEVENAYRFQCAGWRSEEEYLGSVRRLPFPSRPIFVLVLGRESRCGTRVAWSRVFPRARAARGGVVTSYACPL